MTPHPPIPVEATRRGETTPRSPARRRAGFTAVELLVAMTAGTLAISSIYFVSAASSRHFQEQQRVAQTQMSVRMAMERLRRDIGRAGFLGTPNAVREQNCVPPVSPVAAVEFLEAEDNAAIPNAGPHRTEADRLRLTGNFATSDEYLSGGVSADGRTVFLQTRWQSFRRSFGVPFDPQAFLAVFQPNRLLHIVNQQNNHFFVRITGADAANRSVTFAPGIPVGGLCVGGIGAGARVAPLMRLEYLVMDLSALPAGARFATADPNEDFLGTTPHHLVRREIQFGPIGAPVAVPIAGSERVVLEYAVRSDFDFWLDMEPTPGLPPNLQRFLGNVAEAQIVATPHRVRSVIATLAARTPDQNPRFGWPGPRANEDDPFTHFTLRDPPVVGAPSSRVRSLRAEIAVPNLMNRAIRP